MRFLDLITASFVAVLLISNLAALKVFQVGSLVFDGGAFIFPISYIFGDILTEVYGYRRARRVIWTGFLWLIAMNLVMAATLAMPPEPAWNRQYGEAFQRVFALSPRLALAGLAGYFWGEFANSYVLARMKVASQGRHLWMRTIGSTVVGELVDTLLFCTVAFAGILSPLTILNYTLTGYLYKTAVEVIFTPVTYAVVGFLKRAEGVDVYDRDTDFNPFHLDRH
ncbi:MAG: queuosine precursor transporter [Candidatus Eremiobacterota bacterium]